jgi:NADPH:quinone reductase-like Zn-dependent oxidoreductase
LADTIATKPLRIDFGILVAAIFWPIYQTSITICIIYIMADTIPDTFRAWQYKTRNKPFESNLSLNTIPQFKVPATGSPKSQCILIKVHAAALNPADHKVPVTPILGYLINKRPATPGLDYSGVIVEIPKGLKTDLKVGDRVCGRIDSLYQHGTLAEYMLAQPSCCVKLPDSASFEQGAALPTAALSGLQPLEPYVKAGDSVFINGGSGGVGSFTTQIAKLLGPAHVTVTCGPANVERMKSLGADEVINYREGDVLTALKSGTRQYNIIIENVGLNDKLYENCHHFLKPGGRFMQVAGTNAFLVAKRAILPSFLGGGKRPYSFFLTSNSSEQLKRLVDWMESGKLKVEIDEVFGFEKVKEAYEKLRSDRAKGKVVVKIV